MLSCGSGSGLGAIMIGHETIDQKVNARHVNTEANIVVRVMIVEDDPGMLERFAAALVRDPRTRVVEKVRSGREAIARLPLAKPDVLLVDLGLPDIHGTEVIRFAARNLPACDIMVVTVFGDERNVIASIESGATGYVLKDCSDADLVARVIELRAGGSPMSPGIARIVLNQMRAGARAAPPRSGAARATAPEWR